MLLHAKRASMNRRAFLRTAGTAATVATAGCVGGSGEILVTVKKKVTVQPNSGWVKEIPDVSDPGGSISYIARADRPFDVYFFVGREQFERYQGFIEGRDVQDHAAGNQQLGGTAVEVNDDLYEAATKDRGAKMSLDEEGPYFYVLDNSDYPAAGGAFLHDPPEPRDIQLDLTVTKQRFGI